MRASLRHIIYPFLLLLPLLAAHSACGKLPETQDGAEGSESLVIEISRAKTQSPMNRKGQSVQTQDVQDQRVQTQDVQDQGVQTKSAKDGDVMNSLRVWMVNGSGKVLRYASLNPGAAVATVTFDKVDRGSYTLYFLANSTALDAYVEGGTIDDGFLKAVLTRTGTEAAYSDTEGMPLSLAKPVSIAPGVNRISAELVRVCGLVNVTVKNRSSEKALCISSVSLSDRNPSSSYIFQQDDHSAPSGTTYGAFPASTALTRIEPNAESKVLSFYLFESCNASDAFSLNIQGGLYDPATSVSLATKSGYHATGTATNTAISTGKYYFLASASSQRQFLKADSTGALALEDVGSDAELFVKSDVTNYLWQFSSTTSPTVQNFGKGTYLNISVSRSGSQWSGYTYTSSYSLSSSSENLYTSTSTGRQFYGTYPSGRTRYSYLYNNNGTIGVTSPSNSTSSDTNTGWYLREASAYDYQALSPDPEKELSNSSPLSYTDSYGIPQPLKSICRNDRLEVVVNVFYNPVSGTFDFQVESWRTVDNDTTFD